MPYKIHLFGTDVTCDTAAEVKAILNEITAENNGIPGNISPTLLDRGNGAAAVLARLSNTQQSFLTLLVNSGEISDAQACESLHLDNNKVLAGLLAAIHKRFKNAGMPNPVQTEKRFRRGVRSYRYRLSEADSKTIKTIFGDACGAH